MKRCSEHWLDVRLLCRKCHESAHEHIDQSGTEQYGVMSAESPEKVSGSRP